MVLITLLNLTLKLMNKINHPIKLYPISLESQNWLVPIKIGYLIVYHTVKELLRIERLL